MADILYIVVPCYNEEAVLPETSRRLKEKLEGLMAAGKIAPESRVLFVNDGSKDKTWEIISQLHEQCPLFSGADLTRNRGHQNALLAGLMTAKDRCDMAISMDADLQDDIDAVDAMVEQYYAGCDIVYGVRSSRKKDTFFKRFTAEGFYKLMNAMGAETVFNHADYRLMSRRALEGLAQFKEVNLFLRGIVPMIGYRTAAVSYERGERFAGESKYPLKKMLSFAMEGITSLSVKPIRMITGLGFLVFLISIAMLIYSIVRWAMGETILGWASLICSVWAIGGLILLSTMGVGTSSFTSACWMIVLGAGMGFLMQITMLVAQNSVELKDMGVASSTATLFRTIGGSFGVALFGALFNNRVKDTMGQLLAGKPLPPGGAKDPGQTSPAELRKMPDYIQDAYHHAVSNGMHTVFLWGAGVAVIAIAAAVFLREVPLRGTGKGEKPAEASLEAAAV